MMFAMFCGDPGQREAWEAHARDHGSWLGRPAVLHCRPLGTGSLFALATFPHPAFDSPQVEVSERGFRFNPGPEGFDEDAPLDPADLHPRCTLRFDTGTLRATVFPTSPSQLFYGRDGRGRVVGNDMRILLRWLGLEVDPLAVFGLLQYGAIPGSRTLSTRLQRLPGGRSLRWEGDAREPEIRGWFHAEDPDREHPDPETAVAAALDGVLAKVPEGSVLLFSGGVDSGLLAVRLLELGRKDIQLVNYDFGDGDIEARHALRVAEALDWECHQVRYEPAGVAERLHELARDYPFPFSDFSCLTTNLLVRAAAKGLPPGTAIIDGTGADGAFGFGPRHRAMQRVYAVPHPLRAALAGLYGGLRLWKLDSESRLETVTRLARRSVQTTLERSLLAQNPLDGIAFRLGRAGRQALEAAVAEDFESLSEGTCSLTRLSYLDLAMVCAGQFAAKTDEPIRRAGLCPVFPYLEPAMVRQSEAIAWNQKCADGESKGLLKRLLLRRIPRELIYRPKHGFSPPLRAMLLERPMQRFVRESLSARGNPFLAYVDERTLHAMLERAEAGRPVAHGVYSFLWAVTSVSAWTRQAGLF